MMGKFATAIGLTLLSLTAGMGGRAFAQTTPAEAPATQAPTAQPAEPQPTQPSSVQPAPTQPSSQANPQVTPQATPQPTAADQEPADEVSSSRRTKPKDYKNWNYNVGGGVELNSGHTRTFVRQGGFLGEGGVARNANKYLGLRLDGMIADLPLRQSSLALAQAGSSSSYLLAFSLDPIINIPVTKEAGGYLIFGPSFYHRGGSLSSDTATPGSSCNPFYEWWGSCANVSIPLNGSFTSSSQNEFGYNVGVGVTRKMPSGVEVYAEFRIMHGSGNSTTTDVRPLTVGVRW